MPIYEYRCESCGTRIEVLQKISEPPLLSCPKCSRESLVKLVSAAGFQLKGSGWYATDFKGGSSAKPSEESKPEAKTETKPESKTESKAESGASSGGCSGGGCGCH